MSQFLHHLGREWRFMLKQRYVQILLLCTLVLSGFSVLSGLSEISQQKQTIERLKLADEADRNEAQAKYDDPGSLAYYTFHLTYDAPSELAFASLGQRDVYPWKHRVRMLALEGQIYESDAQNAELAQAGKIDFVFVLSALAPLVIILLMHDIFAGERNAGRFDLLQTTARSLSSIWGARITVRFIAVALCLLIPFFVGAIASSVSAISMLAVVGITLAYLMFWTLLCYLFGRNASSAPKVASGLLGLWLMLAFVIPILGDLAIKQGVHAPKGGDIVLTQREAVNDAWDLPVSDTMEPFVKVHPDYKDHVSMDSSFEWKWYYAFQQVGDQKTKELTLAYQQAARDKYDLAGYVSLLSPTMLVQRKLSRMANTDALAAFTYEQQIREFHHQLRMFYYPSLFGVEEFDKSILQDMPEFKAPN